MGPWLPAILNFRICCKFMTQFGWFARVCLLADSVTQTASRAHKGVTGLTSQPSAHLYWSIFDWDKHRLITGLHCTWKPEQFGKGGGGVLPIRTFFLGCYFPSESLKKSCQDNSGHFTTYKKICESKPYTIYRRRTATLRSVSVLFCRGGGHTNKGRPQR